MNRLLAAVIAYSAISGAGFADDPAFVEVVQKWRDVREKNLRADNGWLTLAGRFPLKAGVNTFGVGAGNDVVFPPELKGTGPERLGSLLVDPAAKTVTLKLPEGVSMMSGDSPFSGERALGIDAVKRDWVGLGRIRMHIIEREGRFILRLADNESPLRKSFAGCIWYAPDEKFKFEAKFVPYPEGKTIPLVNVIDEVSKEPSPGYAEFKVNGVSQKLDAIEDGERLLFVFRDGTAGDTTYPPSRFVYVEKRPELGETMTLDFNKAYNPPCAFSAFTTCPLPPAQNIMKTRIEAGEKYRKK